MPVGITVKAKHCEECNQITNHRKESHYYPEEKTIWVCLKCLNSSSISKEKGVKK